MQVNASLNFTQDTLGSPGLPKGFKDKDSNNGGATPVSSAKDTAKREPKRGGNKNFEQLMMAGSMLSP